jgi:transmembrane sensor
MSKKTTNQDPVTLITRFLSGEASKDENERLQAWMDEDPQHRALFDQYRKLWESSRNASLFGKIDTKTEWKEVEKQIQTDFSPHRHLSFTHSFVFRLAAVILIALVTGFLAQFLIREFSLVKLTADQATNEYTLPDGSNVTLDRGATLTYNRKFNKTKRLVALDGTAYFDVTHHDNLPFVVEVASVRVTVLGTAFTIDARNPDRQIDVVVDRGRVSMTATSQDKEVILTPGDEGEWNEQNKRLVKHTVSNPNYLAWKTRHIIFNDMPLGDVTEVLEKVYHTTFRLQDTEAANCHITAEFDNEPVDLVLDIIAGILDLSWEKKGDGFLLSGKGCQK